jgi:hypothetical protein
MSNTTFDAKEAVKYMLDGLRIKPVEPIAFGNYFIEYLYFENNSFKFKYGDFINNIDLLEFLHFKSIFCLADKNLVKWYRPTIFWKKGLPPMRFQREEEFFYRTKEQFFDENTFFSSNMKVLDWEEKYAPATYEECE